MTEHLLPVVRGRLAGRPLVCNLPVHRACSGLIPIVAWGASQSGKVQGSGPPQILTLDVWALVPNIGLLKRFSAFTVCSPIPITTPRADRGCAGFRAGGCRGKLRRAGPGRARRRASCCAVHCRGEHFRHPRRMVWRWAQAVDVPRDGRLLDVAAAGEVALGHRPARQGGPQISRELGLCGSCGHA